MNPELRCPEPEVRASGAGRACVRPDEETVRALAAIAEGDEHDSPLGPDRRVTRVRALEALAALGEDRRLVGAMLRQEGDVDAIRHFRADRPPIADDDLAEAIAALDGDDPTRRRNALLRSASAVGAT